MTSSGDTAGSTLTITESDIDAYADLTSDDNPIYLDDYAGEIRFGSRVTRGMLTADAVRSALADLPGSIDSLSGT